MSSVDLVNVLTTFIAANEETLNELGIVPRVFKRYPFDSISLEIVSKSFSLAKAALTLIRARLPDEAYGLSRTLVECAANLRFITQERNLQVTRASDFYLYSRADKNFWLYYVLKADLSPTEEDEISNLAKAQGYVSDNKQAMKHWSGKHGFIWAIFTEPHPLDGFTESLDYKKKAYAVDYFQTSHFVHCSQPALDNYVPEEGRAYVVAPSSFRYKNVESSTAFTIIVYLHQVLCYATFGLNLECMALWNGLYQKAIREAGNAEGWFE